MARIRNEASSIVSKRHALFFFFIYVVGALLLTFEKTVIYSLFAPGSALPKTLVIMTAIMLMGVYVFFVTLIPATKLRNDVAADNVYYLGFLFTLTSLAVALSIDNADAILANFGVAIISTLIGIAARVGLNQLRVDPADIEEISRLELSDAASRVKAEMNETVRQLTDFRQISLQVLAEGYAEVQKNVETISSQVLKSVETLVEQSSKPLIELAEKTKTANAEAVNSIAEVTKSNQALTKSHKAMANQIEQVNNALITLSEHYSDTGIVDDKVISSVQEQLLKVQNQLTHQAQQELTNLKKYVDEVNNNTIEIRADLSQLSTIKDLKDPQKSNKKNTDITAILPTEIEAVSPTLKTPPIKSYQDWEVYQGVTIYNSSRGGFRVNKTHFSTLQEAKQAITKQSKKKTMPDWFKK